VCEACMPCMYMLSFGRFKIAALVESIMTEASSLEDRLRSAATVFQFVNCPLCQLLFNVEPDCEDSEVLPSFKVSELLHSVQGSSAKTAKRGVGTVDVCMQEYSWANVDGSDYRTVIKPLQCVHALI
jgi:hypothetical protein